MSALATLPLFHRFFFALRFDDMTARRVRAFAEDEFGARGLLHWERLHMTLAITDDLDAPYQSVIDALRRAGDAVAAAPFELMLAQLSGGEQSIALRPAHGTPALRTLQARIADAMGRQGVAMRAGWRSSPHVTLGYRDGAPFWRPVAGLRWPVTQFVLVHSLVGLTRHETLGQWTLRPDADEGAETQYSLF